jgi:acyl-CoA thioesterase I
VERRRFNTILAAAWLLSAATSGCETKPPYVAEEQRAEARPTGATGTPDKDPLVVTFGDSLTAGVAGKSYPDYLQDVLLQHGYHYRVENQGVSGDTTTDGLARIGNVTAARPALVVLEFGGNDGLRGTPIESIRGNLEEMITTIQSAKVQVVLLGITLPPNYGPDYVQPFTAMFPELAKKYKIPSIPFLLSHVYQHPDMMQPDGIHPNGKGNQVIANDVFKLIAPMLKSTNR